MLSPTIKQYGAGKQGSHGFPTPVLTGVRFKGFFSAFLFHVAHENNKAPLAFTDMFVS
jgi:hypothetical protein